MPTLSRDMAGFQVAGACYAIRLYPVSSFRKAGDATVRIKVIGLPGITGFNEPVSLGSDQQHAEFAVADIVLGRTSMGDELRCLRARAQAAPAYREGFVLTLEPGMADPFEQALHQVERISHITASIRSEVQAQLGRDPWQHESDAVLEVVANLEACTPQEAMDRATNAHYDRLFAAEGDHPDYAELGAVLRRPAMIEALNDKRKLLAGL